MNKNTFFSQNNQKNLSQTYEPTLFNLADFGKKQVEVRFSAEQTSHDGGLLLKFNTSNLITILESFEYDNAGHILTERNKINNLALGVGGSGSGTLQI